jgi:hypothetical protein
MGLLRFRKIPKKKRDQLGVIDKSNNKEEGFKDSGV